MAPVATWPVLKFNQMGEGKPQLYLSFMGWRGASAERESRLRNLKGYDEHTRLWDESPQKNPS